MELEDGEGSWPTERRHNRHNELQLTAGRKHTSSFERLLRELQQHNTEVMGRELWLLSA